jgi:2-polyprenyl-6-methoxyphenol hydroxylase-like FAD-dependent oxidoreductase
MDPSPGRRGDNLATSPGGGPPPSFTGDAVVLPDGAELVEAGLHHRNPCGRVCRIRQGGHHSLTAVVIGAGPGGAAAAAVAARRGEPAWLVDRGRDHPYGTLEVLSGRARDSLIKLGWYDSVVGRARPCDAIIMRWADDCYVERTGMLEPHGHGWVVDRAWFDPLVRQLAVRDGVIRVANRNATPLDARRVLATGKHTPTTGARRALGPDMVAVTAVLPTGSVENLAARLLVEAVEDGWWSALDDGEWAAVTYVTVAPQLRDGTSQIKQMWAQAVGSGPSWMPAAAANATPRVRPIRNRLQRDRHGDAVVRVGDAALSVDPLSGHGLALALESAIRHADADYQCWLRELADAYEHTGRQAYAAVRYPSSFWRRLRSR